MTAPSSQSWTLAEIAARLGGDVHGDPQTRISRVATLAGAGAGDISFLANRKYKSQLHGCQAAAVILAPDAADGFAGAVLQMMAVLPEEGGPATVIRRIGCFLPVPAGKRRLYR